MVPVERDFRNVFIKYAEEFRKKHGSWAIFRFPKEGTFLCMDTWNGHLEYKVGSGEYEYWTGFKGKTFFSFNMDDAWSSRDAPRQPINVIQYYYEKMLREVQEN